MNTLLTLTKSILPNCHICNQELNQFDGGTLWRHSCHCLKFEWPTLCFYSWKESSKITICRFLIPQTDNLAYMVDNFIDSTFLDSKVTSIYNKWEKRMMACPPDLEIPLVDWDFSRDLGEQLSVAIAFS